MVKRLDFGGELEGGFDGDMSWDCGCRSFIVLLFHRDLLACSASDSNGRQCGHWHLRIYKYRGW